MWNDSETSTDFIDYQHYVNAIVKIIDNEELLPCSIGVFGDWGSGKSSLMKMVEEKYKDQQDTLIIKFNGWLFEGYEDTKTVLMGSIVDEIISKRNLSDKAVKLGAKILKKIDVIKISGTALKYGLSYLTMGTVGVAAASASDVFSKLKDIDYEKYIKDKQSEVSKNSEETIRSNIQEFHKNFEELIAETKIKRIVVLIDDLDRCSTETIIGTLEAIKLFLFTKNTTFILGADERLIKYAVRRRFPEIQGDSLEVGRDYLEKLIQYPIRIPPLNTLELTTYINLLFTKLHLDIGEFEILRENILQKKNENGFDFVYNYSNAEQFVNNFTEEFKEDLLLSSQITPVLSIGLNGNPRQCKRFLNTLLLRVDMAQSKGITLNKGVLAKLMLLEYFKPETFKLFYESQSKNSGFIEGIDKLEELSKTDFKSTPSKNKDEKSSYLSLSIEQDAFLQDLWLIAWFKSGPPLKTENLQPYYYFSRDRLSISGVHLQRMSASAQEVFKKLISDAESVANSGIQDSAALSSGDASAIFEALTEKINQQGNQTGDNSILKRVCSFCQIRIELLSQLLIFVEKLPEENLPIGITTWLMDASKDVTYQETIKRFLQKWSKSTNNTKLAKICTTKLKQK